MTDPATIVYALRSMRVFDDKPNVIMRAASLIERQAACVEALRRMQAWNRGELDAIGDEIENDAAAALHALDEPEAR